MESFAIGDYVEVLPQSEDGTPYIQIPPNVLSAEGYIGKSGRIIELTYRSAKIDFEDGFHIKWWFSVKILKHVKPFDPKSIKIEAQYKIKKKLVNEI